MAALLPTRRSRRPARHDVGSHLGAAGVKGFAILGTILATLFAGLVWAVDAKAETPAAAVVVAAR